MNIKFRRLKCYIFGHILFRIVKTSNQKLSSTWLLIPKWVPLYYAAPFLSCPRCGEENKKDLEGKYL